MADAHILLTGPTVADPRSPWNGRRVDALLAADGRVLRIAPAGELKADNARVRDAAGQVLTPALADAWCHLTEPGYETRGSLDELAAEAYAGGYADLLGMPTTQPALDRAEVLRGLSSRLGQLPVRIHLAGALTVGAKGVDLAELTDLAAAGARAFTDAERPVQHSGLLLRALQYAQLTGLPILQTPLDAALSAGQHAAETPLNTRRGFKGISPLAEVLALQRELALVQATGAPVHFSPITTAAGVALIAQARQQGLPVSASTSPLYLVCDDAALAEFETCYKVMPPLRTSDDRAALVAAVADGTLSLIASHHQPLMLEEKDLEWDYALPGATGLGWAFAAANTALVQSGMLTLDTLVERMAHAPRRLLGLPELTVAEGADRLVLIDPVGAPAPPPTALHTWPYAGRPLVGAIRPLW